MRIAIVGVGGVGGYFGGRLARAGEDVIFVARGKTLEALRSRGLRVDSVNGDFVLERVSATDEPSTAGPVDAIIMATKAWQVPDAAVHVKPMIGAETIIIPLENGMDAPAEIASVVGPDHVLGGLCTIVSFIIEPGHIRHAAADPIIMFGRLDRQPDPRAERLREAFDRAGVNAQVPRDIVHSMWSKFLFIAPLSGIGAVTRVPVGIWRSIPETRSMAEKALQELLAVARAGGADLADEAVATTMQRYDALAAEATSSLQRDIAGSKPSELEAQLGAVVRMGHAASVPVPVFEFLYHALLPQERIARGDLAVNGAA
jgi:2-dehydropantoate 2-reductase